MSAPLVPVYGILRGDVLAVLVLVHADDKVRKIGEMLQNAASMRVRPKRTFSVIFEGRALDPESTVQAAGLTALDRVDVVAEGD